MNSLNEEEYEHSPTIKTSTSIQDYILQEFLSEGSLSHVYAAKHKYTQEQVAMKIIDKLYITKEHLEETIQHEITLHQTLHHQNIVELYHSFQDARHYYLIMEQCKAYSLASYLNEQQGKVFPIYQAKIYFHDLVKALQYLHETMGIIHCDLKMSNLLIKGETIKLANFKLASYKDQTQKVIRGTPNFIAPEILHYLQDYNEIDNTSEDKITQAIDIWALGCILYCFLVGKPPFEGKKVSETLYNIAQSKTTTVQFPPNFSSSAQDLIRRLLAFDPQERPTARQILHHPWLKQERLKDKYIEHVVNDILENPLQSDPTYIRHTVRDDASENVNSSSSYSSNDSSSMSLISALSEDSNDSSDNEYNEILNKEENLLLNESSSEIFMKSHLPLSNGSSDSFVSIELHMKIQNCDIPSLFVLPENDLVCKCVESLTVSKRSTPYCNASFKLDQLQLESMSPTSHLCIRYRLASGILSGCLANGKSITYTIPLHYAQSRTKLGHSQERENGDELAAVVQFVHIIILRILQLRTKVVAAANSTARHPTECLPIIKWPVVHYDQLPVEITNSLQTVANRSRSIREQLRQPGTFANNFTEIDEKKLQQVCELPGIGMGMLDKLGNLHIIFSDGASMQLNSTGSVLRYRHPKSYVDGSLSTEDVYELSEMTFLPTIVRTRLKHIPQFTKQLKGMQL